MGRERALGYMHSVLIVILFAQGFQRCQCALAQLHCVMEITRPSPESLPCVEGLREN